jgi:hypothetical protein
MAEQAGFSRYTASEKSLTPASCFDNQSKRSLRPSAPSLVSVNATAMQGTYNKITVTKPDNKTTILQTSD